MTPHTDPTTGEVNLQAVLAHYVELKEQLDGIIAQLEALKPSVLAALSLNGGRWELPDGSAIISRERKTWEFSEEVQSLEQQLKQLKKHEQSLGIAQITDITAYPVIDKPRKKKKSP